MGVLALALALSVGTSVARAQPLVRGFADDVWFDAGGSQWIPRTVATEAQRVIVEVDWASVEPDAPASGAAAGDPAAPQYNFGYLDARVREFADTGISLVFLVTDAPRWAESPGGPASLEAAGAWRPSPTAYGQLATALATRYSGSYPDPLHPGQALPRVQYFQAWAEPNLSVHLAPQWTHGRHGLALTGPLIYRGLLNAFYAGIKSVHSNNTVITSGFGPYGDPPSLSNTARMPPAEFVRDLLCVTGRKLKPIFCPGPAHFDVIAIDPYEVGAPTTPALNADDVSAPDIGKLTRIVNRALALHRALPRQRKQFWVTEFSYDSNPPNPTAPSTATQAKWLEESFYVFWHEGVDSVFWYLVRDQGGTSYATSYYSGVYYYDGNPKPSFEAYRFPFVVMPTTTHAVTAWGIAPRSGRLSVQMQHHATWKTLFTVGARTNAVFDRKLPAKLHGNFRATVGGETSLVWRR